MIIESKEQLLKQLTEAWELIRRSDELLEACIHKLTEHHKNLRQYARSLHDEGAVHRTDGLDTTRGMDTRPTAEAANMHRMPARKGQYVLRTRRDTPTGDDTHTPTESGG